LGEHTGVVRWGLLFDRGPRVAYDNGGATAVGGVGGRMVEMGGKFDVAREK